jgi:hypothetical protein
MRPEGTADQERRDILKLIFDHRESAVMLQVSDIAARLGLDFDAARFHVEQLGEDGYANVDPGAGGDHSLWLTPAGERLIREGVPASRPGTGVTIGSVGTLGAIAYEVSGTMQVVGSAQNSEITQQLSDPCQLSAQLEEFQNLLVDAVKAELRASELAAYTKAAADLRAELESDRPRERVVKALVRTLAFLGDIEGTIGLTARVWGPLSGFLTIAGQVIGGAPSGG